MGGYGAGAIANWLFWLALNLVWGFSDPHIGIIDHIGGLLSGIVLAFLLLPRMQRGSI
jgi:membrane associated rhomboid family serine protease